MILAVFLQPVGYRRASADPILPAGLGHAAEFTRLPFRDVDTSQLRDGLRESGALVDKAEVTSG